MIDSSVVPLYSLYVVAAMVMVELFKTVNVLVKEAGTLAVTLADTLKKLRRLRKVFQR